MVQHAIPQNVTTFQFKLIGDMTLKQFGELATGALLAYMVLQSPLMGLLKWPLVSIFGFGGFALAFMPIEDRPLDRWLIAFFRSIYTPTVFIYSKPLAVEPLTVPTIPPLQITQTAPPPASTPEVTPPASVPEPMPVAAPEARPPMPATPQPPPTPQISLTPPPTVSEPAFQFQIPKQFGRTQELGKTSITASQPNLISGMVLDPVGHQLEGVVILAKDQFGLPVRALKSNSLGQFMVATPLKNGIYTLELEKEGLQFPAVQVELKGEMVTPVEIRATA